MNAQIEKCREMLDRDIEKFVPDKIVTYKKVDGVELDLHIFFPAKSDHDAPFPAIVSFFGGGWKTGTIKHFYRQSAYWASRGMVAVCAQYRIFSTHKVSPHKCLADAKSAMRWVRGHSRDLKIDPQRIAAAGGSAGGHLAMSTALIERFNDPSDDQQVSCKPNALVLFNPVVDAGPDAFCHDDVKDYWQDFSPMHNLKDDMPPAVIFFGTEDHLIPLETVNKFKQKADAKGLKCQLFLYESQGHGFFNHDPDGSPYFWQTLLESDRFLQSIGYFMASQH